MISIIICSIKEPLFESIQKNVAETIGTIAYEIVKIDNNIEKLPICAAYNKGAAAAKYDHLLFLHEDIRLSTLDWGIQLLAELRDNSIGIIGLAGSTQCTTPIGGWWMYPVSCQRAQMLQPDVEGKTQLLYQNPNHLLVENVVILDGVFLAIRKQTLFEIGQFNTALPGFHGYDTDISLRSYSFGYKNLCWYGMKAQHLSGGSLNPSWASNLVTLNKLWHDKLPLGTTLTDTLQIQKQIIENLVINYLCNKSADKNWLRLITYKNNRLMNLIYTLFFFLKYGFLKVCGIIK